MNGQRARPYVFATEAQWDACLYAGADRSTPAARRGLHPNLPFARMPRRIPSHGAHAPALSPAGELLWRDDAGHLLRAGFDDASGDAYAAPWPLAQARRLVVTRTAIWAAGAEPGTLVSHDLQGLQRLAVLRLDAAEVVDLAAAERGALYALVRRDAHFEVVHIDCGGDVDSILTIPAALQPARIAYLRTGNRILLLDAAGTQLWAMRRGATDPEWTRATGAYRCCFVATELAADGNDRAFLAGVDGESVPFAVVIDGEASALDCVQLQTPATGIAGGRGALIVGDGTGIAIHLHEAQAGTAAPATAQLLTPLLRTPSGELSGCWLRAEADADLPDGTTLELRYGWTEDAATAQRLRALALDRDASSRRTFDALLDTIDHWSSPLAYAGRGDPDASARTSLAFPLHEARSPELWLHVSVHATPRSALPSLRGLRVYYGRSALLQQLPAVHRRSAFEPGGVLGPLIGTLEATTQDIDRRIAALGALIHPDSAAGAWQDRLAEWLGLPWDDALSAEQKLAVLRNAGALAAQRGTRAGLATLLACLFPGSPPAFRISDVDVDYGFATLGGGTCCGSALPAVLAGLPRSAAVLDRRAILGRACLPPRGAPLPSSTARLAGRVRIEITAPVELQRAARPWLERVLDSVLPAHVRVVVRWRTPVRHLDADGAELLRPAPQPHLGVDAVTGHARLPRSTVSTLSR